MFGAMARWLAFAISWVVCSYGYTRTPVPDARTQYFIKKNFRVARKNAVTELD